MNIYPRKLECNIAHGSRNLEIHIKVAIPSVLSDPPSIKLVHYCPAMPTIEEIFRLLYLIASLILRDFWTKLIGLPIDSHISLPASIRYHIDLPRFMREKTNLRILAASSSSHIPLILFHGNQI
jgi:hypothetical protein